MRACRAACTTDSLEQQQRDLNLLERGNELPAARTTRKALPCAAMQQRGLALQGLCLSRQLRVDAGSRGLMQMRRYHIQVDGDEEVIDHLLLDTKLVCSRGDSSDDVDRQ